MAMSDLIIRSKMHCPGPNRGMGVDFGVEVGIGVHLIFFS